jgi:hypothetical protein
MDEIDLPDIAPFIAAIEDADLVIIEKDRAPAEPGAVRS